MVQEGEEAWLMMGKRAPPSPSSRSDMHLSDDVPAMSLADSGSRFVECCGLTVHYKEALPMVRGLHKHHIKQGCSGARTCNLTSAMHDAASCKLQLQPCEAILYVQAITLSLPGGRPFEPNQIRRITTQTYAGLLFCNAPVCLWQMPMRLSSVWCSIQHPV